MDMKSLFQQIGGRFKRDRQELPDEVVEGFLRVLEEVRIEDMPCSAVFAKLDEYVEKEVDGQDAAKLMPLLRSRMEVDALTLDHPRILIETNSKNETNYADMTGPADTARAIDEVIAALRRVRRGARRHLVDRGHRLGRERPGLHRRAGRRVQPVARPDR